MNWPATDYERQVQAAWLRFWDYALGIRLPLDYSPLAIDAGTEQMWNIKLLVLAQGHLMAAGAHLEVERYKSYLIAGVYDFEADLQNAATVQFLREHLMRDPHVAGN